MAASPTEAPLLFLGRWKWKSAVATGQSSFPVPRHGSTVFSQDEAGIHYVAVGIYSDGQTRHTESTFRLDGNSYPVIGGTLGDSLSAQQLDARTIHVSVKRAGVLSAKVKFTISTNGNVMTTEWAAIVPHGPDITWRTVSEREAHD